MYKEPRYRKLRYSKFEKPSSETLAQLDIPHYKEIFELERDENFFDRLFAKKDKSETIKERKRKRPAKEKKKVWETIKDIFRKKK